MFLMALKKAEAKKTSAGTAWRNGDRQRKRPKNMPAREMGYLHHAGEVGLLPRLSVIEGPRKILTHISNTNPLLDEDSVEYAEHIDAGIEFAYDGMDIEI